MSKIMSASPLLIAVHYRLLSKNINSVYSIINSHLTEFGTGDTCDSDTGFFSREFTFLLSDNMTSTQC